MAQDPPLVITQPTHPSCPKFGSECFRTCAQRHLQSKYFVKSYATSHSTRVSKVSKGHKAENKIDKYQERRWTWKATSALNIKCNADPKSRIVCRGEAQKWLSFFLFNLSQAGSLSSSLMWPLRTAFCTEVKKFLTFFLSAIKWLVKTRFTGLFHMKLSGSKSQSAKCITGATGNGKWEGQHK